MQGKAQVGKIETDQIGRACDESGDRPDRGGDVVVCEISQSGPPLKREPFCPP
jgi:hypothetical protein